MKLIKPYIEIIEQKPGLEGMLKHIEYCGRTSYKSHDKITDDSYKKFIDMLIKSGHNSCLEHGTIYLRTYSNYDYDYEIYRKYKDNPYSRVEVVGSIEGTNDTLDGCYVTSNYRVLLENNWLDDLKYLCEPTEFHKKRITVKVICSIGTSRELNRHRSLSITERSTRYCNYSKNKFGNEVTFIIPEWLDIPETEYNANSVYKLKDNPIAILFLNGLLETEKHYFSTLNSGWKPQQAREVLPLATATEVVYTAFLEDWKHFLSLRSPKYGATGVHPNAAVIGDMIYDEFIKREY